jgi:phage-Barnase-EndoU-ColicinE5/D-RelE like nuclease2/Phage Mu protein F like protein
VASAAAAYGDLPFQEQIDYFRQKVNLPTARWDQLLGGMHARAFTVAGATREDVLSDFRAAVDKAIADGTTLEDFRKDFDGIVARTGWSYKGSRGWRTGVIYRTNVRTAYQAGRYAQMTDPDVLAERPYWRYRHGDSVVPRPQHLAWNGLVLPADDPWWKAHFPPNGWGCSCSVEPLTRRELASTGKKGPDRAPDDGIYRWTDSAGKQHTIPKGIDPGWNYNVGEAAWGRPVAENVLAEAAGAAWTDLGVMRGPASYGRPAQLPAEPAGVVPASAAAGDADLRERLQQTLGGEQAVLTDPSGTSILLSQAAAQYPVALSPADARYLPYLRELVTAPSEVWASFSRNDQTGQVRLRRRYLKALRLNPDRVVTLLAEAERGVWTGLTAADGQALNALRRGLLLWSR